MKQLHFTLLALTASTFCACSSATPPSSAPTSAVSPVASPSATRNQSAKAVVQFDTISAEKAKRDKLEYGGPIMIQYGLRGRIAEMVRPMGGNLFLMSEPNSPDSVNKNLNRDQGPPLSRSKRETIENDPLNKITGVFMEKVLSMDLDLQKPADQQQLAQALVEAIGEEKAISIGIKLYDADAILRFRWPGTQVPAK